VSSCKPEQFSPRPHAVPAAPASAWRRRLLTLRMFSERCFKALSFSSLARCKSTDLKVGHSSLFGYFIALAASLLRTRYSASTSSTVTIPKS
jgi:hypothetical protein